MTLMKIISISFLKKFFRSLFFLLSILILLFLATVAFVYSVSMPSNERDWTLDQAILPTAEFSGDNVTIKNIRNFSYTSETEYTPSYYDKTYNLNDLVSVDFIVEPLAPVAIAHTFVSFGFANGDYISVSVEIRKEKGESFSPMKGLLDQFELMYVVADERDVIRLRALHRQDTLYLYSTVVSKEKMRELFVGMLTRVNALAVKPEFYNTLNSTCTTNIVDHINGITKNRVPWDWRVLFPKDADELAYELGLIDTSAPFLEVRARSEVNEYVEKYQNEENFSVKIREHKR